MRVTMRWPVHDSTSGWAEQGSCFNYHIAGEGISNGVDTCAKIVGCLTSAKRIAGMQPAATHFVLEARVCSVFPTLVCVKE